MERGRRRYPRSILRLPDFERKVFELRFWRGNTPEEIEHQLGVRRNGSVAQALQRVERKLTRRPQRPGPDVTIVPYDETTIVADSSFGGQEELLEAVDVWLRTLEPRARLIVRLKFWENMTADEIASMLRIRGRQRVYGILQRALKKLKARAAKE
jgi:DNA-directed RNA polymerase specialized sigma24 family protein